MAKFYTELNEELRAVVGAQKIFFTASAPTHGRINLSPKGHDTFRVLDDKRVANLDLTGSENETAAHIVENGRLTLMFVQLILNALWSYLFFGLHRLDIAFFDIVALWLVVVVVMVLFWRENWGAGALMLPYHVGIGFASCLNFAMWRMNSRLVSN